MTNVGQKEVTPCGRIDPSTFSLHDMKELMHLFQHLSQFGSKSGSENSRAQLTWTEVHGHLEHYS